MFLRNRFFYRFYRFYRFDGGYLASGINTILILMLTTLALSACGTASDITAFFKPYQPDIVQGNFVSNERFLKLRAGMTKAEVKRLLGTPFVASLFHRNRWDYVFTMQGPKIASHRQHVTLVFDIEVLKEIEGGENLLSEAEFIGKVQAPTSGYQPLLSLPAEEEPPSGHTSPSSIAVPPASAALPIPLASVAYPPLEP
jgi:outer membrane protein assembly factor BamE